MRTSQNIINNKLMEMLKTKNTGLIYLSKDNKTLMGDFLLIDNLENIFNEILQALKNLNKLIWGLHGTHTAFVYSNLVKIGIELFKQILIQNGYLEYSENLQVESNTQCYFCGIERSKHQGKLTITTKKRVLK